MGMSDEAVLAATAVVSSAKGTAEEGGTYLAQLMRTLKQKGGFKGKTLGEAIVEIQQMKMGGAEALEFFGGDVAAKRLKAIGMDEGEAKGWIERGLSAKAAKARGMSEGEYRDWYAETQGAELGFSPAEIKEWFGRAQGQEAWEILSKSMPEYTEALANVHHAQATDAVTAKLALPDVDMGMRASRIAEMAEHRLESSREPLGIMDNIADAMQADTEARHRERMGDSMAAQWLISTSSAAAGMKRWIWGDDVYSEAAYRKGYGRPETRQIIEDYHSGRAGGGGAGSQEAVVDAINRQTEVMIEVRDKPTGTTVEATAPATRSPTEDI